MGRKRQLEFIDVGQCSSQVESNEDHVVQEMKQASHTHRHTHICVCVCVCVCVCFNWLGFIRTHITWKTKLKVFLLNTWKNELRMQLVAIHTMKQK